MRYEVRRSVGKFKDGQWFVWDNKCQMVAARSYDESMAKKVSTRLNQQDGKIETVPADNWIDDLYAEIDRLKKQNKKLRAKAKKLRANPAEREKDE